MIQLSFEDSEFVQKRRITRKERFLAKIEKLVPWSRLIDVIEPHYPKRVNGRPPCPLEIMIRIDCLQQWYSLSDGDEGFIFGDASYRGAEQRPELQDVFAEWFIAENSSRIKELKRHPRKNRDALKLEYDKTNIRAFVEHLFRIIKCQVGFVRAVYKKLKKNDNKLTTLFALANIVRLGQLIRA